MSTSSKGNGGQEYTCLVPIDHTADHRIYPVGAVIRLDHLEAAQVALLVARGYVKPVEPPLPEGKA